MFTIKYTPCLFSLGLLFCGNAIVDVLPQEVCNNTRGLVNQFCVFESGRDPDAPDAPDAPDVLTENYILASSNGMFRAGADGVDFSDEDVVINWDDTLEPGCPSHGYCTVYELELLNEEVVIASAAWGHLLVSEDRGLTWDHNEFLVKKTWSYTDLRRTLEENQRPNYVGLGIGNGKIMLAANRSTLLVQEEGDPMSDRWRHFDCKNFPYPANQGRCNLFFEGVVFANGFWVLYGQGQAGSTEAALFWSDDDGVSWTRIDLNDTTNTIQDVRYMGGRWWVFTTQKRHGVPSIYRTPGADPGETWESYGRGNLFLSSGEMDDKGNWRAVGPYALYLTNRFNGMPRGCRRGINYFGTSIKCPDFNHVQGGGLFRVRYEDDIWRILAARGYFYFSEDGGFTYSQRRFGYEQLNDIIKLGL